MLVRRVIDSPLGSIGLLATDKGLCRLDFDPDRWLNESCLRRFHPDCEISDGESDVLDRAECWLGSYFERKRPDPHDVALDLHGTEFERKVWAELLKIPEGRTETYGTLAQRLGMPKGARAVGGATGRNPICILVPCHRLIGANGQLTGFASGLERKRWLLHHEGALLFN